MTLSLSTTIHIDGEYICLESRGVLPRFIRPLIGSQCAHRPPTYRLKLLKAPAWKLYIDVANHYAEVAYRDEVENERKLVAEIAALQVVCRLIGLCRIVEGATRVLLHGSTVAISGSDGISFLGDGSGKTSLAVSIAKIGGGALVADEFSFFETASCSVTGGDHIWVHIRHDMLGPLEIDFTSKHPRFEAPSSMGISTIEQTVVKSLVFPRITGHFSITRLEVGNLHKLISSALSDHIVKLLNPSRDRVSPFCNSRLRVLPEFVRQLPIILSDSPPVCLLNTIPAFAVTLGGSDDIMRAGRAVLETCFLQI